MRLLLLLLVMSGYASAHELTPTYPKLRMSAYDNVLQTEMKIFNTREGIKYFKVGVYDAEWTPLAFATSTGSSTLYVEPLKGIKFKVYVKTNAADRVTYICTKSRILQQDATQAMVNSRICSKVK